MLRMSMSHRPRGLHSLASRSLTATLAAPRPCRSPQSLHSAFQSASGGPPLHPSSFILDSLTSRSLTATSRPSRPCRSSQSLHSAFCLPQLVTGHLSLVTFRCHSASGGSAFQHFSVSAFSFCPNPFPAPPARAPPASPGAAALFFLETLRPFHRPPVHQREREPDHRPGQRHPTDLKKQSRTGRIESRDRHNAPVVRVPCQSANGSSAKDHSLAPSPPQAIASSFQRSDFRCQFSELPLELRGNVDP